jgi:hypothetical protein
MVCILRAKGASGNNFDRFRPKGLKNGDSLVKLGLFGFVFLTFDFVEITITPFNSFS